MLSKESHITIRSVLTLLKEGIEKEYSVGRELNALRVDENILVLRSARVSVYHVFLEEIARMNKKVHLYVLGEADEALFGNVYPNVTVEYLETKGKFSIDKLEAYEQALEGISYSKIFFLRSSLNDRNISNVHEIVNKMLHPGVEVYQFCSKEKWVKYFDFKKYFNYFQTYTGLIDWYVAEYEKDIKTG